MRIPVLPSLLATFVSVCMGASYNFLLPSVEGGDIILIMAYKKRRLNGTFRPTRSAGWRLVKRAVPRIIASAAKAAASRGARKVVSYAKKTATKRRNYVATPRSGLRYHTRGRTAPRFKRVSLRESPLKKYLQRGVVKVVERGGIVTDANCVYVGHGIGLDEVFRTYCITIFKKLLMLCGRFPVSLDAAIWDDSSLDLAPAAVRFGYKMTESGASLLYHEFTLSTGLNLRTAGNMLYSAIMNIARGHSSSINNTFEISNVSMSQKDTVGVNQVIWKTLEMSNLLVDMTFETMLSLQNRTISSAADPADETAHSSFDVANNPVGGYKYVGRGNGFAPKFMLTSPVSLVAQKTTGLITMDPDSMVGGIANNYNRPPPASSFEAVKRFGGVSLQPGSIRTDNLKHSVVMYNKTFWALMKSFVVGEAQLTPITNAPYTKLGKCAMFAFEKHCNTRVDEPDISIGWELRQRICICFKKKNQVTQMYFENA